MMLRHTFILVMYLAGIAFSQDDSSSDTQIIHDGSNQGYDGEVVTQWSPNGTYHDPEQNAQCETECKRTCVEPCPDPQTCNDDQIKCGEKDHPLDVWPDCIKDDICIPNDCECRCY